MAATVLATIAARLVQDGRLTDPRLIQDGSLADPHLASDGPLVDARGMDGIQPSAVGNPPFPGAPVERPPFADVRVA
jgi:hypothetical protein